MPDLHDEWIYIADAAKLIAFNRTIDEAREALMEAAHEELIKLRAFRLKSNVYVYSCEDTQKISQVIKNGDPFDSGQMPTNYKHEYNVDENAVLDEEVIDAFRYSPVWFYILVLAHVQRKHSAALILFGQHPD